MVLWGQGRSEEPRESEQDRSGSDLPELPTASRLVPDFSSGRFRLYESNLLCLKGCDMGEAQTEMGRKLRGILKPDSPL